MEKFGKIRFRDKKIQVIKIKWKILKNFGK
jgi:hypothetical protein